MTCFSEASFSWLVCKADGLDNLSMALLSLNSIWEEEYILEREPSLYSQTWAGILVLSSTRQST